MKKSIIAVSIFLFAGVAGYFVLGEFRQKPEISTELSERSKEYLAKDKDGSVLGKMYLGEKEALTVGKKVNVDNCFTLTVPFPLKTERKEKECDFYMAIEKPRGSVVAYLNKEPSADWENVPGISMRRQTTWTYAEKSVSVNGMDFLTFRTKDEGKYHRSAFYRTPTYFLVINLEGYTGENLDKQFEEMLASVKIKK